ncbi:MAG: hypothetical protein HQK55_17485 [Deltaproteobacteria bacterium]|nr:hypothetical protein [Deltaproteobacteria bacterium]
MTYPLPSFERVLVIGTTTDYIDFIDRRYPHRAIFVTDPAERLRGKEKSPDPSSEILVALEHPLTVFEEIRAHLTRHGLKPSGVACFDCESMYLSSLIAREFGLPYPSSEAILAGRSKFISKERWQRAGLDCPVGEQIEQSQEAADFRRRHNGKLVIKPLTGSGSELIFICTTDEACSDALETMRRRLEAIPKARMYD